MTEKGALGLDYSNEEYSSETGEGTKPGPATETEETKKPDDKMKKLVVVVIIILLLGLMAAALYTASQAADKHSTGISVTPSYLPVTKHRPTPVVVELPTQVATRVTTTTKTMAATNGTVRLRTRKPRATTTMPKIVKKKVVCALGSNLHNYTTGPTDGVCDYLLYDSLYLPGLGTLIALKVEPFQWFFDFVRKHQNGLTEYGISFDYASAALAFEHVNQSDYARAKLREIWDMGISHYAMLRAPAILIPSRKDNKPTSINELMQWVGWYFRFWRGNRKVPIYRFLGIDHYQPFNVSEEVYDNVATLVNDVRPHAIIFRSHFTIMPNETTCRITATSSYNTTFNYFEASMVETISYVLEELPNYWNQSFYVSFTMRALQFYPASPSTAADYNFGKPCTSARYSDMLSLCSGNEDFKGSYDQSMMTNRAVLPLNKSVIVYDTPQTIMRKMCAITKDYPEFHLGIALYDIDFEDTQKLCTNKKHLNDTSGYWRVEPSSAYMKTVLTNVSFHTKNQPCP